MRAFGGGSRTRMLDYSRIEQYRENNRIEAKKAAGGLLMFGYEYEISRYFPTYFLDYQERLEDDAR